MGKKCLKCGYERSEADSSPEIECPKCGAIYSKVEALAASATAPIRTTEPSRRTSAAMVSPSEYLSSSTNKSKASESSIEETGSKSAYRNAATNTGTSYTSKLLFWLAVFGLIGGFYLCFKFWPSKAEEGYEWKTIAYSASMISFGSGVTQFALFMAISKILDYLAAIEINTRIR